MKAVKTTVAVDGRELRFKSVRLKQSINEHHSFKVVLDIEAAEAFNTHVPDKSKAWLGKSIMISFDEQRFLGVVTNLSLQRESGTHGGICLSGLSRTYKLEGGKHLRSWCDKELSTIVRDVVEPLGLSLKLNPEFTASQPYECQYEESNFQFIRRLACQYGEWLYYDGESLVFGKPKRQADEVKLVYGRDIQKVDLKMQTLARRSKAFSYSFRGDNSLYSSSPNNVVGLGSLGKDAFDASLGLFPDETTHFISPRAEHRFALNEVLRKEQEMQAAESFVVSGESNNSGVRIGGIVYLVSSLDAKGFMAGFIEQSLGTFFITSIVHQAEEGDTYVNYFEGIASTVPSLPSPDASLPLAHTQRAEVIDNADPQGIGCVRVRFQWQNGNQQTDWIEVMSPDAGSSGNHPKNRGFVFIPEVGDHVMVGFHYNDPNRPFVMGSLFNGKTGAGGGAKNNVKSIITRSGHVVEFNDTDRKESITIKDKKGCMIKLNTADSSIEIYAPENISLEAKNISLTATESITNQARNIRSNASENISTSAGENVDVHAGSTFSLSATDINEQATDSFDRVSKNASETAEKVVVDSTKEDMELTSKKQIVSQSGEKVKLF
ncbi:MAG: type VI secretion system Vgr family protein [Bacteroidales bacterium]